MRAYDIDNLDHDNALAIALGNMVVAWARAEAVLSFVLAAVCGLDANMATIGYYRIPTFEARTKFLRALITEWQTDKYDKEAISTAITKLNALARSRNDWVHGLWCLNDETQETMIFDFRRDVEKGRRKPVKAGDVAQHVLAVRLKTNELHHLIPGVP